MSRSENHVQVWAILFNGRWADPESLTDICTILHAVAPSLQRLLIIFPLLSKKTDPDDILRAFDKLSAHGLVKFISGPENYDGLIVRHYPARIEPRWAGLRRLMLHHIPIDNHFLTTLSTLPCAGGCRIRICRATRERKLHRTIPAILAPGNLLRQQSPRQGESVL
ncbi:hypothetical protein BOTBODRAFT_176080 [Botryobasidium botryosum FD-172 SS1]|uniref:Uncharacterized protein n=1 Tax=Botryobasidium botryosum (strain FD-172 SS1) TaxID=930990 RepID=A0A067MB18_BOTB1|nr:hypothetical protein BOTBODRAFT_176080 [Botryobasidium botryosum FD-172 SS1]